MTASSLGDPVDVALSDQPSFSLKHRWLVKCSTEPIQQPRQVRVLEYFGSAYSDSDPSCQWCEEGKHQSARYVRELWGGSMDEGHGDFWGSSCGGGNSLAASIDCWISFLAASSSA